MVWFLLHFRRADWWLRWGGERDLPAAASKLPVKPRDKTWAQVARPGWGMHAKRRQHTVTKQSREEWDGECLQTAPIPGLSSKGGDSRSGKGQHLFNSTLKKFLREGKMNASSSRTLFTVRCFSLSLSLCLYFLSLFLSLLPRFFVVFFGRPFGFHGNKQTIHLKQNQPWLCALTRVSRALCRESNQVTLNSSVTTKKHLKVSSLLRPDLGLKLGS